MKKSYLKTILASLALLSANQAFGMVPPVTQEDKPSFVRKAFNAATYVPKEAAKAYGIFMTSLLVHEIGHAVTGTLLYRIRVKILFGVDMRQELVKPEVIKEITEYFARPGSGFSIHRIGANTLKCGAAIFSQKFALSKNRCFLPESLAQASVFAAGPLAGIAALYAISKGIDIVHSYDKNKSMKQIFTDGIRKKTKLFGGRSAGYYVGSKFAFMVNIANLTWAVPGSDAEKILAALFKNKDNFELACNVSSVVGNGLLLYSFYKLMSSSYSDVKSQIFPSDPLDKLSEQMQEIEEQARSKGFGDLLRENPIIDSKYIVHRVQSANG